MSYHLFTSESVTEGHPDKVCDQVSDAVLDAYLTQDPKARVACETFAHKGLVHVAGQVTTTAQIDVQEIVRETLIGIGYNRPEYGIDGRGCAVLVSIDKQSPDIAQGVDSALEVRDSGGKEVGAGDQGLMFGYACDDTPELMPLPIALSHSLARQLAKVRHDGTLPYLRPDGKTQVTIQYEERKPVAIDTVLISTQHDPEVTQEKIHNDLEQHVIRPVLSDYQHLTKESPRVLINPTGIFVMGGPEADTGLTGRKIIVDTYGGMARHGGGAFSGKDATKVDRSANYAARWVAKNIVGAGLATECEVALSYAIGVAEPVSVSVNTFNSETVDSDVITKAVEQVFDLRPGAIIEALELRQPIYKGTAAYGHFGRPDLNLPWEALNRVDQLKETVGSIAKVSV